MDTRETILAAALDVLEQDGEARFSTRRVQAIANVTAPTIYHHFGNVDGLLGSAVAEAFRRFLASKEAAVSSSDPVTALREGWDDYVRFAADRPRLYATMMTRVLGGARMPAAEQATALLVERVRAVADTGRLAVAVGVAVDQVWASANAAALLHVTAQARDASQPDPTVVEDLRNRAMRAILTSHEGERR